MLNYNLTIHKDLCHSKGRSNFFYTFSYRLDCTDELLYHDNVSDRTLIFLLAHLKFIEKEYFNTQ